MNSFFLDLNLSKILDELRVVVVTRICLILELNSNFSIRGIMLKALQHLNNETKQACHLIFSGI